MSSNSLLFIRVLTYNLFGQRNAEPNWQILDRYDVEDLQRIRQPHWPGEYIVDVEDLGLETEYCLGYLDAAERMSQLKEEEWEYGECHLKEIAECRAIMNTKRYVIEAAVKERFDAWTRRKHLVALGVDMGLPSFNWTPVPCDDSAAPAAPAAPTEPAAPPASAPAPDCDTAALTTTA
jgi:hypothetical protein